MTTPLRTLSDYALALESLYLQASALPLPGAEPLFLPASSHVDAPTALIFSPHPDDEVIIGGWPLRLLRQCGWRVINVAVTLGSNPSRKMPRLEELQQCCKRIGFGLVVADEVGLDRVNLGARREEPERWSHSVSVIVSILRDLKPKAIFYPHSSDYNTTHIGVNALINHALLRMEESFECSAVETEFWAPMECPNLLVESTATDVGMLLQALACHVGEIQRNPYHLRVPAWMSDNVRRGAELVGGQGGSAPEFIFGTLYRLRRWRNHKIEEVLPRGEFLTAGKDPATLLLG
ncbi:MAG: PIG-L family deacetylase [Verrucomicrobiota bacterium]|nr:PIG-L family deacetylase [Verrucomicrobiota bacterium]